MRGRFIFPSCGELGLEASCYIRNSFRNSAPDASLQELAASIKVYSEGKLVAQKDNFARLALNEYKLLSLADIVDGYDKAKNYLVAIDSVKENENDPTYFPQEHHLFYEYGNGKIASLLYDQQPYFPNRKEYSDVLVLAPKGLVSCDVDTNLVFANSRDVDGQTAQQKPMEITVLDEKGSVVATKKENLKFNSVAIFSLKNILGNDFKNEPNLKFFNIVAKGGESVFSIITLIVNKKTGNVGVEHSLPPNYYTSGDKKRIREEALCLS